MSQLAHVHARIDAELYEQLREHAAREDRSVASLVRVILTDWLLADDAAYGDMVERDAASGEA